MSEEHQLDVHYSTKMEPLRGLHAFTRMIAFALPLVVAIVIILTFQLLPSRYQLNEGDVARLNIKSPQKVSFISQIKTKEERDRAEETVGPVFVPINTVASQQRDNLLDIGKKIGDIRRESATVQQKRDTIKKMSGISLPDSVIDDILAFDEPTWRSTLNEAAVVLDGVMKEKISDKQVAEMKGKLPSLVGPGLSSAQAAAAIKLAESFVTPNQLVDEEATAKAKKAARDGVSPVRVTLERGEMILRDGDIVRPVDIEKLEAAGLRNPNLQWQDLLGTIVLAAILVASLTYYLHFFQSSTLANGRRLLLLALVITLPLLSAKLMMPGREFWAYLFLPTAAAAMLVSTLLSPQLAIVNTMLLSVMIGIITNFSLEMTTLSLVSGLVGTLGARRIERMHAFFVTGLVVAVANFAVIAGFELFSRDPEPSRFGLFLALAAINGALSAALAFGTFSFLGHIFGITTSLGLMELAHPTHPLFHRLLTDAPGTYHHSMVVANLAERAAQQIGADGLLCRVASYYHDVGKVVRPYFFIENQEGTNAHDQLDPKTSAQIIASHVKDGLELARRHSLPSKVHDIIEQHHGTHIVAYFYQQACQSAGVDAIDQHEFRYPGPRPQTREAGIVMLADSVEAVIRSSRDQSPEHIAYLVRKVVNDRLADGQLDECDVTLRDLDQVRNAFTTVLQGIFHPRIEYPETATLLPDPRSTRQIQGGWIDG